MSEEETELLEAYTPKCKSIFCSLLHIHRTEMRNPVTGTNSENYSSVYAYIFDETIEG